MGEGRIYRYAFVALRHLLWHFCFLPAAAVPLRVARQRRSSGCALGMGEGRIYRYAFVAV
jgi:hypothetical protein